MLKAIKRMLKGNVGKIFVVLAVVGFLFSFASNKGPDPKKDKVLLGLIRYALVKGHYEPKKLDDNFSEEVYSDFIETLDPRKQFFIQKDLTDFAVYKDSIDDQVKDERLDFYKLVIQRLKSRINEVKGFYKEILAKPFDFNKEETINIDFKKIPFAANKNELIKIWQKQLKLNTLARIHDKIEEQNNAFKKDSSFVKKSFKAIEKEARERTQKNIGDFFKRLDELNDTDWFSSYLNSITATFDPHTSYFAPKAKEMFDISMAGKIEGIGARLQKKDDYTKVVELIAGGPAWKQGGLEVGDIILKVAQGNKEPVDITGMRLDDAIEYIKGKKGTLVKLTVKKIDGSIAIIPIVRDIVEFDENFVKSSIVKKGNKTFGVIKLPKFYIDFNEKNYRNSATDMAKEIKRLKNQHVDGLLIDLRNNGGGSLKTAIEIAGLFIKKGPIVQVRYRGEKPIVRSDKDIKIQWDGPLVILVNELSASASEIFAAAMQDYNRAVIIGSNQTFGKGTVQDLLPLNKYYNYDKPLGALKMTIQKFYRINGGSTQLKGVHSDIVVPNRYAYMKIGERDEENPLPWDKISPATYSIWKGYKNFDKVVNDSKNRIASNPNFSLIDKNAKWLEQQQKDNIVPLNYKEYQKDLTKRKGESKQFKPIYDYNDQLKFTSPNYELVLEKKDTILAGKRKVWHKNLSKDIYIEEAINVLSELRVKDEPQLVEN